MSITKLIIAIFPHLIGSLAKLNSYAIAKLNSLSNTQNSNK